LNTSLNPLNILTQYTDRWAIEPFLEIANLILDLMDIKLEVNEALKDILQ